MPAKKMLCNECDTIFNRKPKNGAKQICWNCQSYDVSPLVGPNGTAPPPSPQPTPTPQPTIPQAPDISGLRMPVFSGGGGGGLTAQMLIDAKKKLKRVVRAPVQLPGPAQSTIPRGVRLIAHSVRQPVVTAPNIDLLQIWSPRNSRDEYYAYLPYASVNVSQYLGEIARGHIRVDHSNFNSSYRNLGRELPTRKGPRVGKAFLGVNYFEYGWKRTLFGNERWAGYSNGARYNYSVDDNRAVNAYVRNVKHGQIFCERLVVAETGELFYTPDHYTTFFRYHPGTFAWYEYKSAGGATGPVWDESFYEPPGGR